MKKIGLTGGIGSGKSTAAAVLKHLGYPVYISDKEASRLMDTDEGIRSGLIRRFGKDIYTEEGRLDKARLAGIIFHDKEKLQQTDSIVHPRVMEDFGNWASRQESSLVFFESAILFEAGLDRYFSALVCITASEQTRIERVMKRDHAAEGPVKARIRTQMDEKEKCSRADHVIRNDRDSMIVPQILEMVKRMEAEETDTTEEK